MHGSRKAIKGNDGIAVRYISYKGKSYPLREVDLGGDVVMVGSDPLERALMENDGVTYKDDVAQEIDEHIYCYVGGETILEDQEVLEEYVQKWFT